MEINGETREDRRHRYELTLRLSESENPIKTLKLQALLLTNAILLPSFFALLRALGPGPAACVGLLALASDGVWVFSIGRTVAYQRLRKFQLESIRAEDLQDPLLALHAPQRTGALPWWGRMPSSWYLVGTPIGLTASWAALLVWLVLS